MSGSDRPAGPDVVALGGGHGLAATIRAVRDYARSATAVVATADDGGSTGRLRSGMKVPALGDLRRCLVAMAGMEDELLGEALEYRFGGTDVAGHALGNLLLAALDAVSGDFVVAVDEVGGLLGLDRSRWRVLPATVEPVELHGATADGQETAGQVAITQVERIERVWLDPPAPSAPRAAVEAIRSASQVVLGPGSLYTSVLAAAAVPDLRQAIAETSGRRVYVCNLRSDTIEAQGYDVSRHVEALRAHGIHPDTVVVDANSPLELGTLERAGDPTEVVKADVARPHGLSHDSAKLVRALRDLCR